MNKELRELLKRFNTLSTQFDEIKVDGDIEEVRKVADEMRDVKERIELIKEDRNIELGELTVEQRKTNTPVEVREMSDEEVEKEYESVFLRAFKKPKSLTSRDSEVYERVAELRAVPNATPYMQSAVDEDGGFIVPHSVSTLINEYKRQGQFDLTTIVDVEFTSVLSGEFTYQTLADAQPMPKLEQWDTITEGETPQFERKSYKIEDYAEIIPLPRTLLQDSDQNILRVIAKWIAVKTLVTRNAEILKVVNATFASKKPVTNTDDFKDVLNVELDPAFYPSAKVITNELGFNYLSKLKDNTGKYLMQPDPTVPDKFNILGKEIIKITSKTLPSTGNLAPVYIGDLKEAIRFYDRGVYEVTPTTIGGDAFKRNSLDTRIIDRFDVIALDPEAVVACSIDVTFVPEEPVVTP